MRVRDRDVRAVRDACVAEHPARPRTRARGGGEAAQDTVTADTLQADKDAAAALGDEHAVTVIDRQIALLDNLPDGPGSSVPARMASRPAATPALQLGLIDARYRPQRLVDTAHRAFIGRHLLGWSDGPSAGRYRDVQSATAHSVMVRLAVLDAEPFSTPTTEGASA